MKARWLGEEFTARRAALERFARNLGADPHLAEDLATETFLRAARYFETRNHRPASLLAFLMRVERNLYLDHCRREARRRASLNEAAEAYIDDFADTVAAERDLYTALRALPNWAQAVLFCTALNDMTLAETATALGLPSAGAAGVAAYRARKALAQALVNNTTAEGSGEAVPSRTHHP